jgi:hypothetical protein
VGHAGNAGKRFERLVFKRIRWHEFRSVSRSCLTIFFEIFALPVIIWKKEMKDE